MSDQPLRRALALATALALPVALAAPAGAAAPTPCFGMFATDPVGDSTIGAGQADTPLTPMPETAGTPETDLKGFFLNHTDKLTVNFQLGNVAKNKGPDAPQADGGVWTYAHWQDGDSSRFVRAANKPSGEPDFGYGIIVSPGFYITQGETTGTLHEGADGVVEIVVPAEIAGDGTVLGKLIGVVDVIEGEDDVTGINHHADSHVEDPDVTEPNGEKDYTVGAKCPAGGTAPPPTDPGSGGGGGGGGGGTPPPGQPQPQPQPNPTAIGPLPISVPSSLGSARKASRKKKLTLKVTASKPITDFQLQMKKGAKTVATFKAASLKQGANKLSLKVKKLKAGKYVIGAIGKVDGRDASFSKTVKLKK